MWLFYIGLVILLFYGAWKVYQLHTKYMRLVMATVTTNNQADEFIEAAEDASAPDRQQEENSEGNDFIDRATKIVIEHISDSEFSIDRLCREMAMSRTLFYVKLKSYTGKSPQDFIRIIRLERAAALLRNGRSVTDAAALAGFDNPKYFSTVFKKYFGVSPSKFE
jgi:AraC-like DNA-binding protein